MNASLAHLHWSNDRRKDTNILIPSWEKIQMTAAAVRMLWTFLRSRNSGSRCDTRHYSMGVSDRHLSFVHGIFVPAKDRKKGRKCAMIGVGWRWTWLRVGKLPARTRTHSHLIILSENIREGQDSNATPKQVTRCYTSHISSVESPLGRTSRCQNAW